MAGMEDEARRLKPGVPRSGTRMAQERYDAASRAEDRALAAAEASVAGTNKSMPSDLYAKYKKASSNRVAAAEDMSAPVKYKTGGTVKGGGAATRGLKFTRT